MCKICGPPRHPEPVPNEVVLDVDRVGPLDCSTTGVGQSPAVPTPIGSHTQRQRGEGGCISTGTWEETVPINLLAAVKNTAPRPYNGACSYSPSEIVATRYIILRCRVEDEFGSFPYTHSLYPLRGHLWGTPLAHWRQMT